MKSSYPYILAAGATACCWYVLFRWVDTTIFTSLYDTKLQLVFFTAFLTVGSFLLAMKAFILVRIKDDIYRHKEYKARYLSQCNNEYKGNYYKGLVDLGHLLVVSVAGSFVTSIAQITIGYSKTYWVKLVAPSLVGGMLVLVFLDWLYVYLNLRDWFNFIEKDMETEIINEKKNGEPGA